MSADQTEINEQAVKILCDDATQSGDLICCLSRLADETGRGLLEGAHQYQYAAMIADFIRLAHQDERLSGGVLMKDGKVKSLVDFLMDDIFNTLFAPIVKAGGDRFIGGIKQRAAAIVASRKVVG